MRFPAAVAEFKKTHAILAADVDEIIAYGKRNSSEFALRTLVRTHFALVEGLTSQLLQVALVEGNESPGLFSADEMGVLRQKRYELSDNGTPKSRPVDPRLLPSIRFAIDCFSKIYGVQVHPEFGTKGWHAMKELQLIRNRLTHPQNEEDLQLTRDDRQLVMDAAGWFNATMTSLFKACS